MRRLRSLTCALIAICGLAISGCLMVGRADPAPPAPQGAPPAPDLEYALGDFTFQMNAGDPHPSHFDARLIGNELFDVWEERGYVAAVERVETDAAAAAAEPRNVVHVTLSGRVHAETSFWAELLNAVTLFTLPYPVTNRYEVELALRGPDAATYVARAATVDETWVGLALIVGLPFAERGHTQEMARLADALYADLRAQGAFAPPADGPARPHRLHDQTSGTLPPSVSVLRTTRGL